MERQKRTFTPMQFAIMILIYLATIGALFYFGGREQAELATLRTENAALREEIAALQAELNAP